MRRSHPCVRDRPLKGQTTDARIARLPQKTPYSAAPNRCSDDPCAFNQASAQSSQQQREQEIASTVVASVYSFQILQASRSRRAACEGLGGQVAFHRRALGRRGGGLHESQKRQRGQRARHQISLAVIDPVVDQQVQLLLSLDAFGDRRLVQFLRQGDQHPYDGPAGPFVVKTIDEFLVDLDDVDREVLNL